MTYADLFTGFGGATLGAINAGLKPIFGIEYDAKIAAVANDNLGGHVIVANILDVDPHTLSCVDVLHASPPCPNFSQAKTDGKETDLDKALAGKVNQFIHVLKPRIFTLENVYQYRNSESWAMIQDNLFSMGYWVSIEHVNAADYGVPQTRQRMIVRAVQGGWIPYLPAAQRWVGWYEAIEDLIPTLPESQFAPWQLKRLPEQLQTLAFGNNAQEWGDSVVYEQEPFHTVIAQTGGRARAFIIEGSAAGEDNKFNLPIRMGDEPVFTMRAQQNNPRAFLIDHSNAGRDATLLDGEKPAMTIQAWHGRRTSHMPHAYLSQGKVVSMTPRALARFQSFPDTYRLPDSKTLAARGIGNAVAPLLYQRIIEGLL